MYATSHIAPTSSQARRISLTDTAKLVRAALKHAFPATTFSVRSRTYSGGSSIDVTWTDGPSTDRVQPICDRFEGAHFDGSIDLKSYHDSIADTGNGPERVRFGADFVHAARAYSVAHMTAAAETICASYSNVRMPTTSLSGNSAYAHYDDGPEPRIFDELGHAEYATHIIHQLAYATSAE